MKGSSRKLAYIVVIEDIQPIEGADQIEVATVKGWKIVVNKLKFKKGDHAIYCEIDSFLPVEKEFEFLRKTSYCKMQDIEGFRLKTIKLRGQISQGLLLPIRLIGGFSYRIGSNVTQALGVVKYEAPIPASLSGIAKGPFPSFIPKTDEERIQNLSDQYESLKRNTYSVSEKLDGTSVTYYMRNDQFGVCSRNLELIETDENTVWKMARLYEIEDKLRRAGRNLALQGELIGENVQGNPYRISGQEVRFFYAFDIDSHCYLSTTEFDKLMVDWDLEVVPVLSNDYLLPDSIEELLIEAEGISRLSPDMKPVHREGLVFRNADRTVSFKAISNNFLLKNT